MTEESTSTTSDADPFDDLHRRLLNPTYGTSRAVVTEWYKHHCPLAKTAKERHRLMSCFESFNLVLNDVVVVIKKKLVFVVHGMNDEGTWMEMVQTELQKLEGVIVEPIDFGLYGPIKFILGWGHRNVKDHVLHNFKASEHNHKPDEIIIIAHSFGTYVVSEILQDASYFKVSRLIYCGSVLHRKFQFDRLPQSLQILNECGGKDVWPVFASGFRLTSRKYGAAGVFGLRQTLVKNRYHDFGHSDYLKPQFVNEFWTPYVKDGTIVASKYQNTRRPIPLAISHLATYGWYLVIVTVFLLIFTNFQHLAHIPAANQWLVTFVIRSGILAYWLWVGISLRQYCCVPPK